MSYRLFLMEEEQQHLSPPRLDLLSPSLSLTSEREEGEGEKSNWNGINKELIKNGYPPISSHDTIPTIISTLLEDIKRKDTLISHLTSEKSPPPIPTTNTTTTPRHDINLMKKQLTDLQYTNAKLRVDVLNRPHTAELKACQLRVNELEAELKRYKECGRHCVGSDNTTECMKDIATILNVDQLTDVVPHVLSLQYEVEQLHDIKPYLQSLSSFFPSSVHSDIMCPSLWSNVLDTITSWNQTINELKDLQLIFFKLYSTVEEHHKKDKKSKGGRGGRDRKSTNDHNTVLLSCRQMEKVLKFWLTHYDDHQKGAEMGVVMSMIHHFQELFDVQSLGGVYVAMTTIYRQLRESHTAYRQLTELLGQPGCSWQRMVSLLEGLLNFKEKKLYFNICEKFGQLSYTDIIDSMTLSQQFLPQFHSHITQLQSILGVESLSALLPAVKRLTYNTVN